MRVVILWVILFAVFSTAQEASPNKWQIRDLGRQIQGFTVTTGKYLALTYTNRGNYYGYQIEQSSDLGKTWAPLEKPITNANALLPSFGNNQEFVFLSGGSTFASDLNGNSRKLLGFNPSFMAQSPKGQWAGYLNGDLLLNRKNGRNLWEIFGLGTLIRSAVFLNEEHLIVATDKGLMDVDLVNLKSDLIKDSPTDITQLMLLQDHLIGSSTAHPKTTFAVYTKDLKFVGKNIIEKSISFFPSFTNQERICQIENMNARLTLQNGEVKPVSLGVPQQGNLIASFEENKNLVLVFQTGKIFSERRLSNLKVAIQGKGTIKIKFIENGFEKMLRVTKADEIDQDFFVGDTVEIEAVPRDGFEFESWGNQVSKESKIKVQVKDTTEVITAVFKEASK